MALRVAGAQQSFSQHASSSPKNGLYWGECVSPKYLWRKEGWFIGKNCSELCFIITECKARVMSPKLCQISTDHFQNWTWHFQIEILHAPADSPVAFHTKYGVGLF